MTRSRRRAPFLPVTTASSDKGFKQAEHRRERAALRSAFAAGDDPPAARLFGDPWNGEKDGKLYAPEVDGVHRK